MGAGNAGGPFTGLYQGGGGAADASAALKPLLPNISVYQQGSSSAPQLQNQITTPAPVSSYHPNGALASFEHFMGGVASETGHIAEGAASWVANFAESVPRGIEHTGSGLAHGWLDRSSLDTINNQNKQLNGRLQTLQNQYKQNQISRKDYLWNLHDITQSFDNLDKQSYGTMNRINADKATTINGVMSVASTLVTILTAGFGASASTALRLGGAGVAVDSIGGRTAAEWLAGKVAAPMLEPAATVINRLATNSRVFQALDHVTQGVLQRATAEVVATTGGKMTAAQIAKATASNIALKYPLYFNYMSSTANQVYQELDSGKYSDAVRQLGFNALLLLSGGPIGTALKYGGRALKGVSERTFGQTSFWDELSKYYGDGKTSGFALAIQKAANAIEDPAARAEFIRNLSAVEATNVAATGGDVMAAVGRLARGEQAKSLSSLTDLSHEQAIEDMVKMAKNFRMINDTAEKLGLGPVAVGRFDVRSKSLIAKTVSEPEDVSSRLKAWEDLKAQNPNDALANNASLDRQVQDAITHIDDSTALQQHLMKIEAQTTVDGFPQKILDAAAKEGYVPIKPRNLEAPFKEGDGSLVTSAPVDKGMDFFTRAVEPLPILGSVGQLFTHLGLSPNASVQRVGEYFNDAVAKNLESRGAISEIHGESLTETAQDLVQKLSDYAHGLKVPVMDLRMMTRSMVQKALGVTAHDASQIQKAIVQAHLDVPLAVRGMGDRAVDWTYKMPVTNAIERRYLRVQGALRFSFNPFFQYLRVIPKTEMLTAAEGGGYLNSIFSGRARQIGEIRRSLRAGGLLDEVGSYGNVDANEAVDAVGSAGRNINKHLLPMQERSIAGLIDAQAQRMGMGWKDYIAQYPHQAADTIQMIAEYDRNSNFLNSPLARTLNIAIFPFRFDTKVATIFAKNLGKTNLLTQVSVVTGLMKAHAFLNSPEGQAWYAKNSEVIGIFKYITPIASLSEAAQSLLPGHDHSLGNFGELGGLPFGWIPQLLDAEGLTHFNQPIADPKTGNMIPKYVPKTTKGQAIIAIQDLLGSLFSYPGATAGLASKSSITRNAALGLTGGSKKTDLQLVTPSMSADQQQYQKTMTPPQEPLQPTNTAAAPGDTQTVKPSSSSVDLQAMKAAQLAAAAAKRAARPKAPKKSDFTPIPAPGQSALGVI